ncbi:MAG: FKBP-type peptidyl-prolyl cis-trans isomerase [Prevotella sp.]|jgi:FKBP-type peptidyl-prolyl cis-trans isomerase SlyD|nr:FKBP-type peptidyl-prolyl cis-trans isomerase [Prevotella sp.]
MDNQQNKYISVSYQLYSISTEGTKNLEEETQQDRPFQFISGFGFSLDAFEKHIVTLEAGEKFDFTLTPAEAFGNYEQEGVHKLSRDVFSINGHFDHENIFPGAVITLMNEDEKRFMARIVSVEEDGVTVDTNHPLAGKTLQFIGTVLEKRDATNEEIQHMLNHLSGEGCGCGCDDCEGGCGHHHEDGCGHHHHHEDGCGCGHCHH